MIHGIEHSYELRIEKSTLGHSGSTYRFADEGSFDEAHVTQIQLGWMEGNWQMLSDRFSAQEFQIRLCPASSTQFQRVS